MARASVPQPRSGARGFKPSRQGAVLGAVDPRAKIYGIGKRVSRQLGGYLGKSPFEGLPTTPSRTPKPKTGQFAKAKSILADLGGIKEIIDSPTATPEQKQAAERKYQRAVDQAALLGLTAQELADYYYDPKSFEYYESDSYGGTGEIRDVGSAVLTDIPTSSTNAKRPRTVAAGYDEETQTVTVIFRDGTAWNYYGVPEAAWLKFSQSITKGQFLNNAATNRGRGPGDLLTYDGHGPADISALSPKAQQELYRMARAGQVLSKDKRTGFAQQAYKPKRQPDLERAKNREYYLRQQRKLGNNPNQK